MKFDVPSSSMSCTRQSTLASGAFLLASLRLWRLLCPRDLGDSRAPEAAVPSGLALVSDEENGQGDEWEKKAANSAALERALIVLQSDSGGCARKLAALALEEIIIVVIETNREIGLHWRPFSRTLVVRAARQTPIWRRQSQATSARSLAHTKAKL